MKALENTAFVMLCGKMEVQGKQRFSMKKFCTCGGNMYKYEKYRQLGLEMNPENRWVKKAATIPWDAIENKYANLFSSKTSMPAKPLRMVLGSLMIQK